MNNDGGCLGKIIGGFFTAILALGLVAVVYAIPNYLILTFVDSNFFVVVLLLAAYVLIGSLITFIVSSVICPYNESGTTKIICPSVFRTVIAAIVSVFYQFFGYGVAWGNILDEGLNKRPWLDSTVVTIIIILVIIATTILTAIKKFRLQEDEWYKQYRKEREI